MPCHHTWDQLVVSGIRWAEDMSDVQPPHGITDISICRHCGSVEYQHPFLGKLYLERK